METKVIEQYVRDSFKSSPKLSSMSVDTALRFSLTGLCEETGEVARLMCRESYKGEYMSQENWLEELGDVLWYLAALTVLKGFTFEDIFNYNVNKLERRYGDGTEKYEQLTLF